MRALPIRAVSLAFAYDAPEDRLSLLAADGAGHGVHVALTRRLTERLTNGLARLLERSNALASQAPAALRDDIILLEHQDALFGRGGPALPEASVAADGPAPALPAARLVGAVDVTLTPATFEVSLRDGTADLIGLSLDRLQVHRLVEVLSRRADAAGWNLALDAAWLEPGQTEIVFN